MSSEPIDARTHRVLSGVSRVAVLEVLRVEGPLDVQAIAARVALHPNTVRSHLDQLMQAGLVQSSVSARATPGRPRLSFGAVVGATSGPDDSYRLLAGVLAGAIGSGVSEPGAVAVEMGKRWGEQAVQAGGDDVDPLDEAAVVDRVVKVLDDIGFAPTVGATEGDGAGESSEGDSTLIELHRCPFFEVAHEHRDVVCGLHLGLMQGALEQLHAPPTTVRLDPFVRPNLCRVHLTPGTAGAQDAS